MSQRRISPVVQQCIIAEFERRPHRSLNGLTRAIAARCAELGLHDRPSRGTVRRVVATLIDRAVVRRHASALLAAGSTEGSAERAAEGGRTRQTTAALHAQRRRAALEDGLRRLGGDTDVASHADPLARNPMAPSLHGGVPYVPRGALPSGSSDDRPTIGQYEPNDLWFIDTLMLSRRASGLGVLGVEGVASGFTDVRSQIACVAIVDAASQAVMAAICVPSTQPIPWGPLVRRAILPKVDAAAWPMCGVPKAVQFGHHVPHGARPMVDQLSALGVRIEEASVVRPTSKGAVERWFAAAEQALLPIVPPLADATTYTEILQRWIVEHYHETSRGGGASPRQRWEYRAAGGTVLGEVDARDLDALLPPMRLRRVTRLGVIVAVTGRRAYFWCPALTEWVDRRVRVQVDPTAPDEVTIRCPRSHAVVGTAVRMSRARRAAAPPLVATYPPLPR